MAIFVTCSVHWILTVIRFFRGFLGTPDIDSARLYFADNSKMTQVIRSAFGEITLLIGDAVIIHRLWLIWNRNLRVIVLPVLSWLGVLVCAITVAYLFSRSSVGHDPFVRSGRGWPTATWVLTVITSIYCTAFIAWKVWRTSRAVKEIGDGPLMSVLAILVESAAIWTRWVVFFAVFYQTGSVLQYLTAQLTPPIIGLVNIFIHLRVHLGWSRTLEPDGSVVAMTSSASMVQMASQWQTHTARRSSAQERQMPASH
ncbi:hypothetical protein B0H14DRAFT_2927558 [Mycena olivaceomarginata]|nr:hypothetical protein B0H14DRAFT_2927558 [Mycena olivaceomarginata]